MTRLTRIPKARPPQPSGLHKHRIEALCDGVFAIAMTLLVFEIKVPDLPPGHLDTLLPAALAQMGPQFLAYAMSFVMLGIYWVAHHHQFHVVKRTNRVHVWLHVPFFMVICFIPFSATLLGRYPQERLPYVIYGLNLVATNLLLAALWDYATRDRRLTSPDLPEAAVKLAHRKQLTAPVVYLLAIGLAFVDPRIAFAIFLVYPLRYLIPDGVDRQIVTAMPNP